MSRELLKQALDVIEGVFYRNDTSDRKRAIAFVEKIELHLEKPEPEPICASCKAIGAAYSIGNERQPPKREPLRGDVNRLIELVIEAGENRKHGDFKLMHIDIGEAIEIATALKANGIGIDNE